MALNILYRSVKGQPLTPEDYDNNLRQIVRNFAPLEAPVFSGPVKGRTQGTNAENDEFATVGYLKQQLSGAQAQGNVTYAAVGVKNVFTQPQIAQGATADNELVIRSQLKASGFEPGDCKWSLFPRAASSGWVNVEGQSFPSSTAAPSAEKDLYAALFAAIGYTYGGSAAEKIFKLPDLRARVLAVTGAGISNVSFTKVPGGQYGADVTTLGYDNMVDHQHSFGGGIQVGQTGVNTGGGVTQINIPTGFVTLNTNGMLNKNAPAPFSIMQATSALYLVCKL